MVKVSTEKITEEAVRSLFECMVSEFVSDEKEYEEKITQNKFMCKARIPAHFVNTKAFRAEISLITFTYTKTTKMIQVQGSATLLDRAEETLYVVCWPPTARFCVKAHLSPYQKALRCGAVSRRALTKGPSRVSWKAAKRQFKEVQKRSCRKGMQSK